MNDSGGGRGVEFLLIRSEPPCRRCIKAEKLLNEISREYPGKIEVRAIRRDEPEAEKFGPALTPMIVMNNTVISAGIVPVRSGLEKLARRELEAPQVE